jgi:lipoprotein-anchoring transpeptidase ErfK/SrfK
MIRVSGLGASVTAERPVLFGSKAPSGPAMFSNSFWRIALLAAAGAIGTASQANAVLYYWSDSDPGFSQAPPPVQPVRQKPRHRQGKKIETPTKEAVKPQGPLIIAISIERQNLKVYDANGFFAETPVSTGMRGHSTPMGVFSVIQKHKFHRSNIYSGAPMPYMQRITWSGVAMHAGVLPGYPASHGCIRMPMAFAVKMWGWTRMGARVVVTPGEMTPSSFSHPLLTAQHPAPTPVASTTTKSDKAVVAVAAIAPTTTEAAAAIKREQAQTADASATLPSPRTPATMSDATPSLGGPASIDNTGKPEAAAGALNFAVVSSSEDKPAIKPAEALTALVMDAGANAPDGRDGKTGDRTRETNVDAAAADLRKDQARPSDADKAAAAKADPVAPKRSGQIAVFISRKDGKLYVRQNFAPLFEVPVTIAASDRPLGTHVFTAQADKDDSKSFHWSVVTLPMTHHAAERRDDDERVSRRRRTVGAVGAVEMKSPPLPDSPAEALDRITIPADTMAKITDALSSGASIIVSDQGIMAGETGEGTDFIVSLR